MIVTDICIDESGTHDDSPYMIMGGVVARNGQWQDHDKRFCRLLKKNLLTYFHAYEMRHNENEYKNWSDYSKLKLVLDINKIQQKTTLFRFATVLNKGDYEREYKSPTGLTRIQHDTEYGICFRVSLSLAVEMLERTFETPDFVVNFLIEDSHHFGDAHRIFKQIQKHVPDVAKHLGNCVPVGKKDNYGVQSADAISYAAYKHEALGDQSDLINYEPDWYLKDAKAAIRERSPVLRAEARPDILRDLKEGKITLQNYWKEQGDKARLAHQKAKEA